MVARKKSATTAARSRKRAEYKELFKSIPAKSQKRDKALANKKTLEKPGPHAKINRRYLQSHDLTRIDTKQESGLPERKRAPRKKKAVTAPPSEDIPPIPKPKKRKKSSGNIHLIEKALMGPKKKKRNLSLQDYQREQGMPIYEQMAVPEPDAELPPIPRAPRVKNPEFRKGILSLKGRSLDEARAFIAHKKDKVHGASAGLKSYHSSVDRIEKKHALKFVKAYDKSLTRKIRQ